MQLSSYGVFKLWRSSLDKFASRSLKLETVHEVLKQHKRAEELIVKLSAWPVKSGARN